MDHDKLVRTLRAGSGIDRGYDVTAVKILPVADARRCQLHAPAPGPLMTRAASGIAGFDGLMAAAVDRSPLHRLVTPEDIGALTAFLVSDAGRNMSGGVHFVDAGYNIIG